jgi:hypothetical protein
VICCVNVRKLPGTEQSVIEKFKNRSSLLRLAVLLGAAVPMGAANEELVDDEDEAAISRARAS